MASLRVLPSQRDEPISVLDRTSSLSTSSLTWMLPDVEFDIEPLRILQEGRTEGSCKDPEYISACRVKQRQKYICRVMQGLSRGGT